MACEHQAPCVNANEGTGQQDPSLKDVPRLLCLWSVEKCMSIRTQKQHQT